LSEPLSHPGISVTVGILGAVTLVLLVRRFAPHRDMLMYGVGLGITAVAYLIFGLRLGAPRDHLELELVGAVLYGTAAVLGARRWPALLALGWTAHAVWDLSFHYANGPAFAPAWYALFCVGFDLPVGAYIAGQITAPRR
jgi:hypothetical protein